MRRLVVLILAVAPIGATRPAAAAPAYEQGIAAILRARCAGCHRDADASGGLSVETFARLSAGGESGAAIVPGDAAASLLVQRLEATDDAHMPPADQPQPSAAEKERLRAWIAAGAPGPAADRSILADLVVPTLPQIGRAHV